MSKVNAFLGFSLFSLLLVFPVFLFAESLTMNCTMAKASDFLLIVDLEKRTIKYGEWPALSITDVSETHVTATVGTGLRKAGGGILVLGRFDGKLLFAGIAPSGDGTMSVRVIEAQCSRKSF